ncbi:cell division ATPase FtsA [Bradyrhizobium sp. LB7.1]
MNQADEPGRRPARVVIGVGPGLRQRLAAGVPKRDADMAQAAEVARDLIQPGVRIGRLVEIGNDHPDEFAREPDHALVFGLHARPGFRDLPADIDGEPQRQQQRQQQVDAPAQG